ncbi:MAG: hypothetical protein ABII25_08010 [bacterium]
MKKFIFIIIIFICSPNLLAEELTNEKTLFIQTEQSVKKDTLLPEKFLTDKIYGKRMLYSDDKDVFLTYLFLLKNFGGDINGEVKVHYKDLKEYLYPDMITQKANEKILKILNVLYRKYELIKFDRHLKENPKIKLLSLKESHMPYKYPNVDYLVIPEILWTFGWEKRLSLTGLYTYLINLMEIKLIPFDTRWAIDSDMLALKYNLSVRQIQQGMKELQQYSLLDAQTAKERNIFNNKPVIKYKILPLYPWENAETQWENIKINYKNKDIGKASKFAATLYKKYDPNAVEKILKLMEKFPSAKLKKAFNILDKKPDASPERSFDYLDKIISSGE